MGRRARTPNGTRRRQVEAMAAYDVPEKDIARVLLVDPKTLRKHYRDELDTGHVKANSRIAESLYRKAMGDGPQSVTACIFWLKTRAQWKETTVQEQTVTNLTPTLIVRQIIDPTRTSESVAVPGCAINGSAMKTIEHIPDR